MRMVESGGSSRSSNPPKLMFNAGSASVMRTAVTAVAYTQGLRMTLCARRAQAWLGAVFALRRNRMRPELMRGPSTPSSAGRAVSEASIATPTAAMPP